MQEGWEGGRAEERWSVGVELQAKHSGANLGRA